MNSISNFVINFMIIKLKLNVFKGIFSADYFQEIEGVQYDIRITGDPVVFDGEKIVSGETLTSPKVTKK